MHRARCCVGKKAIRHNCEVGHRNVQSIPLRVRTKANTHRTITMHFEPDVAALRQADVLE
jgi:hypothetical protein